MAAQFPGIKPSSRSFKLGQYPVKVYRAASGATVKRAFGNRAYGYELQVAFENITDAVAAQIIDHYNNTQGGFERFTLPAELFAGMTATLTSKIQSPELIRWEYAGAPELQSAIVGRSSVTLSFIGELDY